MLEWSDLDLSVAMVPVIIQTLAPSVICGFPAASDLLLIDAPSGISWIVQTEANIALNRKMLDRQIESYIFHFSQISTLYIEKLHSHYFK